MDASSNRPDASLSRSLTRLLICALAIVSVPLITLFVARKSIFENLLHYNSDDSFLYSAIVAVVLVHVVLVVFVYTAWTENGFPAVRPEQEKQD